MLEAAHLAAELDLDLERVVEAPERTERPAQQLPQLVLARQPHRVADRDRVERPLGRAVEAEDRVGRELLRLDRHLADREDVGLDLGLDGAGHVELEPVAGLRVPREPGLPQRECELATDHGALAGTATL